MEVTYKHAWIFVGCTFLVMVVLIVMGGEIQDDAADLGEESETEPEIEVSTLRARLQREIDRTAKIEGKTYRIDQIEYDEPRNQITVVLNLQFRPESEAFLKQDASEWIDIVLYSQSNGKYILELDVDVRVSLRTVISPEKVVLWGDYRHFSGQGSWSPGPGMPSLNRP